MLGEDLLAYLPFSSPSRHVRADNSAGVGGGGLFREGERERGRGREGKKKAGDKIIATLLAHQDLASNYSRNSMSWSE